MIGEEIFDGAFFIQLFLGIVALLFLYWHTTKDFDYWEKRGIPYVRPAIPFLGSLLPLLWRPAHEVDQERYRKLGPVYGQFDGSRPVLTIADPKVIREVLVKQFSCFTSRRISHYLSDTDLLKSMLFVLAGEEWKQMRGVLSPCFTPGKLKRIVNSIKLCGPTVVENIRTASKSGKPLQVKPLYVAHAMDVIASAAFSFQLDSYNDRKNKFVQSAEEAFTSSFNFKYAFHQVFPKLAKFLGIKIISQEPLYYFKDVVLQIIDQRQKTGETRNDLLQFMLDTTKDDAEVHDVDIRNDKDDMKLNYVPEKSSKQTKKRLTLDQAVAQCVSFFIAGYDTMASNMSFVTYNLALHPDVQNRAFEEVKTVLEKTKGELTYDSLQEMKYVDNVIFETMRLYPALPRLERMATEDCKLEEIGVNVPKGMAIVVPTYALHRDPELFEDPDKFNPDRFSPEERAKRDPYSFLPFGDGPRYCLGMRYAFLQVKICIVSVIANFKVFRCPETKVPMEYLLGPGLMTPKDVALKFEERTDKVSIV